MAESMHRARTGSDREREWGRCDDAGMFAHAAVRVTLNALHWQFDRENGCQILAK